MTNPIRMNGTPHKGKRMNQPCLSKLGIENPVAAHVQKTAKAVQGMPKKTTGTVLSR
jgi:hypothetical protein